MRRNETNVLMSLVFIGALLGLGVGGVAVKAKEKSGSAVVLEKFEKMDKMQKANVLKLKKVNFYEKIGYNVPTKGKVSEIQALRRLRKDLLKLRSEFREDYAKVNAGEEVSLEMERRMEKINAEFERDYKRFFEKYGEL